MNVMVSEFTMRPMENKKEFIMNLLFHPIGEDEKKTILSYMNSCKPVCTALHPVKDWVKDIYINAVGDCYEKDGFFWTRDMIYHFEHYDLELTDEFKKFVLNRPHP